MEAEIGGTWPRPRDTAMTAGSHQKPRERPGTGSVSALPEGIFDFRLLALGSPDFSLHEGAAAQTPLGVPVRVPGYREQALPHVPGHLDPSQWRGKPKIAS